MELLRLEHKKLWRRTGTRVCVFICFLYLVVFAGVLGFQWFNFGSTNDATSVWGRNFDGYEMIRASQDYAGSFGGVLTDESLQQMVAVYQRLMAEEKYSEQEKANWRDAEHIIDLLYPELAPPDGYSLTIWTVQPEKLTGLYERRQAAIQEFLLNNGQTGPEMDYLLKMNAKVEEPFKYGWTEGWQTLLGDILPGMGTVMALFTAIVLCGSFAGEWQDNTAHLLLTTRNGWRRLAAVKILSGLCFSLELFALLSAGCLAAQLIFLGTEGWDLPVQLIKMIAVAPMNMLQAELYEYAFALLGLLGYAATVMLISALTKNKVAALILSLAAVYGPLFIDNYLPYWGQRLMDLLPLVGSSADIFRTNTFPLFGKYVWSPVLLLIVPVTLGALCLPFAVNRWAKRPKV